MTINISNLKSVLQPFDNHSKVIYLSVINIVISVFR